MKSDRPIPTWVYVIYVGVNKNTCNAYSLFVTRIGLHALSSGQYKLEYLIRNISFTTCDGVYIFLK